MAPSLFAVELSPAEIENRRCLTCHGQQRMTDLTAAERRSMVAMAPGKEKTSEETIPRPGLFVGPKALVGSMHANISCVSCHTAAKTLPHAQHMPAVDCGTSCHVKPAENYRLSSHAQAAANGNVNAPSCSTCHGGHDILPKKDRASKINPLNIVKICGDCHEKHAGSKTPGGHDTGSFVSSYLDSVHGKAIAGGGLIVAATCADCHSSHAVLPASDVRSSVNRTLVPKTCSQCHVGVAETYVKSIHGQKLAEGDENAPVCSDCHTSHSITRTSTPSFKLDIVNECGHCHDKPLEGGKSSLYDTYRQSYHGQVTNLGSSRAARCSDCHGAHDILPASDPGSRINKANLIQTCRHCHKQADAKFAQFAPHADFHDGKRFPILHGVWLYFVIMMSAAFGFFGLHSVLWFGRSLIDRIRHGPMHRHHVPPGGKAIQRFSPTDRINHALVIISFFGLTLTGMPLLFSDQRWGMILASLFGGVQAAGIFHRIFAVMLIINFIIHGWGLLTRFRTGFHRYTGIIHWMFGPHTMLPTPKDALDCLGMFLWFFGLRKNKPKFDRWTYWEKFDYMAEVGGSFIIGASGMLLWFPVFFSHYLPGWVFNIAMIVHGYEAMLAVGFIFTIHFFNAHLRLEKFPVDDVMFTGQLSEEEFKEERPAEYERLVKEGRLEKLFVPKAPSWQRPVAVIVGILAMIIGTTIVVLIILGGLHLIK